MVRKPDEKLQANNSHTGNNKIDLATQGFNSGLKLEVTVGEKAPKEIS